jgi:HlyD family secretion protein
MSTRIVRWLFWPTAVLLVLGTTALMWRYAQPRSDNNNAKASNNNNNGPENPTGDPSGNPDSTEPVAVNVVKPRTGAMPRVTTLPCSIEADEVEVRAQVSGLLKSLGVGIDKQPINIGSVVKKGDLLATIDVPEIEKQVEANTAAWERAKARVKQMEAKVGIAKADVKAAKAQIVQARANASSAAAYAVFIGQKRDRYEYLFKKDVLEGKLLEEVQNQHVAAMESENAANAAIVTGEAKEASAEAKVVLAQADVTEAESQVKVAKAELDRAQVRLDFAKITAEFDGEVTEITRRLRVPGAFIRSASEGSGSQSILTLQRTDVLIAVVQIPDREARYADPGDPATIEIDALEKKIHAKLTRIAKAEDKGTRLMRVEIDIENPDGLIRQGMFGKATILLDPALKQLSIPSRCLVGSKTSDGSATVYVVRDGKVYRTPIRVGVDNQSRVEVLSGLRITDEVVVRPPSSLFESAEVNATPVDE